MTQALALVRLNEILHLGRKVHASDIHIRPGTSPALRVEGSLHLQPMPAATLDEIEEMVQALLSPSAREHLGRHGDVTVTHRSNDDAGCVRVHAYKAREHTALALRLLPGTVPKLIELALPPIVGDLTGRRRDIVLFTEPTGSDKTTALAAFADRINRDLAKHIITLEDPIEYEHTPVRSMITQRSVGEDTPSFASAIHSALRSDPDVLVVGEMRDAATMHAALTAAETGHLVCTTLHTGDACQTVERIVNAFTGDMQAQIRLQLAQTLLAVVCMRLVPRIQGGRTYATEVLVANAAVRNVIRDGKTHQLHNIMATSRHAGMRTLQTHLAELVGAGEIAPAQAALLGGDNPHDAGRAN
ncbi:MAG TPA: PilT/PilU family type 4a pilus ATPase [Candidatus Baltobacteraceae bacterium]|nr:PilT/PilU family type 4a pilus ATPase [Candidatus Baltobacteraceae bacterium]